jgi:hypothetical protein
MSEIQTKTVSSPSGYSLTLSPANGSVAVGGAVNATTFIGDGSQLSNLPAGGDTVDVSETVIWSGSTGSGSITMSQSMLNFDFIAVFGGGEHQANQMHTAAGFVANAQKIHGNGYLLTSYSSTHFWYKASSATSIQISTGNSQIRHVVGYKLT